MKLRIGLSLTILLSVFALSACGGGGGGNGNNAPSGNATPSASISVSNTSGYAPLTLSFDASASSDSDGRITGYSWDFGDGFTSQEVQVDHIYTELGTFTVVLTVTDDSDATSSSQTSIDVHAQAAGFYVGVLDSTTTGIIQDLEVHIGSDYRLFAITFPPGCTDIGGYSGTITVSMNSVSGTLLADTFDDPICVFPDGSSLGNVDVTATVDARASITAIYDGVGDTGTIQLDYIPEISERQPSLANISGVWSYSDGLGFMETMTIQPDGQFVASATDGCNYFGTFTIIDPRLNELEIIYDITCPPGVLRAGDGQRIGLAFVDDLRFTDEWLFWDVIFQEGPLAGRQGGSGLSRPKLVAVGSSNSVQKSSNPQRSVHTELRNNRNRSK